MVMTEYHCIELEKADFGSNLGRLDYEFETSVHFSPASERSKLVQEAKEIASNILYLFQMIGAILRANPLGLH